jgi:hypothetical protein
MTRVRVAGELSRRKFVGIGPLRRERWSSEPFDLVLEIGESVKVGDDLHLRVISSPQGIAIEGRILGIRCVFGDIPFGSKTGPLTAFSVGSRRLNGRADLVEDDSG